MRPLLLLLLAIAGAFVGASHASAQCYGPSYGGHYSYGHTYGRSYCAPGYHTPSYCYPRSNHCTPSYSWRSTCSDWFYQPWEENCEYYVKRRTCYDHCGNATNYNDGWLYCRYWHCGQWCYRQHSPIPRPSPILAPTSCIEDRGQTQIVYYGPAYDVARSFPRLMQPGMLNQKALPAAYSANEIMAPFESTAAARVDNAHKEVMSGREFASKVYMAEQQREADQAKQRHEVAVIRELGQQEERFIAGLAERRAGMMNQATYQGDRAAGAGIAFDTAKVTEDLGKLLNDRCVKCHGAEKQSGKLDLRDYAAFDAKKWRAIRAKCDSGEMPQDGNPLTEDELDEFDAQIDKIRGRT